MFLILMIILSVTDALKVVIQSMHHCGQRIVSMTPEMLAKLRRSLIKHEGYKNFPYTDSVGKITIGIGYNLTDRGLCDDWIDEQYKEDIHYFYQQLLNFPWFQQLTLDRQIVLIDMAFMGWKKFLTFNKMIKAIEQHDYNEACYQMLNSKWADQVGQRAKDLAHAMATGVYDV